MQKSQRTGRLVSIVSYSCPSIMIVVSRTQFQVYLPWDQRPFSIVSSVLNVKALVGAISVVVKTGCGTDGALHALILCIYNALQHGQKQTVMVLVQPKM